MSDPHRAFRDFVQRISGNGLSPQPQEPRLGYTRAVVNTVDTANGVLGVSIEGNQAYDQDGNAVDVEADYAYGASYSVGDVVEVLTDGSRVIAVMKIARGTTPPALLEAELASTFSVPASTATTVKWDYIATDTDSGYASGTGLYTVATAGRWLIDASVSMADTYGADGTKRQLQVLVNGVIFGAESTNTDDDPYGRMSVCFTKRFAVGDTVKVQVYQGSAGAITLTGFGVSTFNLTYLGS